MPHIAWPKIKHFHNIAKNERSRAVALEEPHRKIHFNGKVKLHGTNGGIRVQKRGEEWSRVNGRSQKVDKLVLVAQSRNRDLGILNDNAGFAAFVERYGRSLLKSKCWRDGIVVYGEWCGPGIQHGVAVNDVPEKFFAVFGVLDGECLIVDPDVIRAEYVAELDGRCIVIDWEPSSGITIDFGAGNALALEHMNLFVDKIENCCSFSKKHFDVEGIGEGLVYFPVGDGDKPINMPAWIKLDDFVHLGFKVKGGKHAGIAKAKPIGMTAQKMESVLAFTAAAANQERLHQGLTVLAVDDPNIAALEMKGIGHYLQWLQADVAAEMTDELVESGLEWKNVKKRVCGAGAAFYRAMAEKYDSVEDMIQSAPPLCAEDKVDDVLYSFVQGDTVWHNVADKEPEKPEGIDVSMLEEADVKVISSDGEAEHMQTGIPVVESVAEEDVPETDGEKMALIQASMPHDHDHLEGGAE